MIVRPYTDADFQAFQRVHAESGLDYKMPDLSSPLFVVKMVVERAGKPTTLIAGKLEVESYLMVSGTPESKWQDIRELQKPYLDALWEKGLDSTFCVVHPEVDKRFAKRMSSLGWQQNRNWLPWERSTVV